MVVYKEPCFCMVFFCFIKSVCRGSCYHVCMSDYNKMGKKETIIYLCRYVGSMGYSEVKT